MQILFCIMWSAYVVIYMFSLICLTTYNLRCAWLSGSTSPVAPAGRSRIHLSHWRSRAHSQKRRHVLSIPGLSPLLRPSLMPPSLSTGVRKRKILWVDSPPQHPQTAALGIQIFVAIYLHSHHATLPQSFIPSDLKHICSTNPFLDIFLIPSGLPSRNLDSNWT